MLDAGSNDAPALAKALVGLSMGRIAGSDVALETADIVLSSTVFVTSSGLQLLKG